MGRNTGPCSCHQVRGQDRQGREYVLRAGSGADPFGLGRNYKLFYQAWLLTETETKSDIHPPAFDIKEQSSSWDLHKSHRGEGGASNTLAERTAAPSGCWQ
jgi:hypothetical protein